MKASNDPDERHRRSIRLKGFNYTLEGAYFVTVCTQNQACLFGDVVEGEIRLNDAGRLVQAVWEGLPEHYPHVSLDHWVIMPNHVHGIVFFVGAGVKPAPMTADTARHGLPEIVRAFKTFSARRINSMHGASGRSVWQRNYYEHIIRDDDDLNRIRQYIMENPLRWSEDPENPALARKDGGDAHAVLRAGLKPAPTNNGGIENGNGADHGSPK